jgi:hypothetical protein
MHVYLVDDLEHVPPESSDVSRAVVLFIGSRFIYGSVGSVRPQLNVCCCRDGIPVDEFAAPVDRQRRGKLKNAERKT